MGKHYYILGCRSTGMGAYTTMQGERYNVSRTGNHWTERIPVEVGSEIVITDITNSGKHRCRLIRIVSVDPVREIIVEQADDFCQFCSTEMETVK